MQAPPTDRLLKNKQTQGKTPRLPLLASCFVISQVGDIGSSGQHLHRVSGGTDLRMQLKVQPRTKERKKRGFFKNKEINFFLF